MNLRISRLKSSYKNILATAASSDGLFYRYVSYKLMHVIKYIVSLSSRSCA
jgi:hypothetical protein